MGIAFLAVVSLQSYDGAVAVANLSLATKTVSASVEPSSQLFSIYIYMHIHTAWEPCVQLFWQLAEQQALQISI